MCYILLVRDLTGIFVVSGKVSQKGNEHGAVVKKTKVEDDEYKTTTEEHTYYRFVSCYEARLLLTFPLRLIES